MDCSLDAWAISATNSPTLPVLSDTLPNASDFAEGLAKTDLSVAFSMKQDETSSNCQYIAAAPHNLESWGDFEFKSGHYSMMQPTIRPLFDTKQFQERQSQSAL